MSEDCMKCLDDVKITKQEIKELDLEKEKIPQQQQQNKKEEKKDKTKEIMSLLEEL